MCFSSGDNGSAAAQQAQALAARQAQEAQQREAERAARLRFGVDAVNRAFDGYASDSKVLDLSGLGALFAAPPAETTKDWRGASQPGSSQRMGRGRKESAPYQLTDGFTVRQLPGNGVSTEWGIFNQSGDLVASDSSIDALSKKKIYYGGSAGAGKVGGIPDSYYTDVRQNIRTIGMGDLEDQTRRARENLLYSLGRAGLIRSSVGNQEYADLASKQSQAAGKIELQARDAENKVRTSASQARDNALSQLYATENPDIAANSALTRSALILQDKPDYNPLGDIFNGIGEGIGSLAGGVRRYNASSPSYSGAANLSASGNNERIV